MATSKKKIIYASALFGRASSMIWGKMCLNARPKLLTGNAADRYITNILLILIYFNILLHILKQRSASHNALFIKLVFLCSVFLIVILFFFFCKICKQTFKKEHLHFDGDCTFLPNSDISET